MKYKRVLKTTQAPVIVLLGNSITSFIIADVTFPEVESCVSLKRY